MAKGRVHVVLVEGIANHGAQLCHGRNPIWMSAIKKVVVVFHLAALRRAKRGLLEIPFV